MHLQHLMKKNTDKQDFFLCFLVICNGKSTYYYFYYILSCKELRQAAAAKKNPDIVAVLKWKEPFILGKTAAADSKHLR